MNCLPMMFPGQASQSVGMAQELAAQPGPAADFLNRVDEILDEQLTRLMFEGPLDELTETRNAQPAILAHSVALVLALRERDIHPAIVAGHSLGEFSAAVAAEALTPEDGLRSVRKRGELMYAAGLERPGGMAAVMGLPPERVSEICHEVTARVGIVCLANHNSASQVVISGEMTAVETAGELLKEAGAKRVVGLQVSGAFHSPLLAGAAEQFATYLEGIDIADPSVPLVANVTGRAAETATELADGFKRQLTAPVLWQDCLDSIIQRAKTAGGVAVVLEVGPGRVLTNLAKRIYPDVTFLPVGSGDDLDKVLDFLGRERP
jgi:[acyl-carrier-protein] S-malonyltransferase